MPPAVQADPAAPPAAFSLEDASARLEAALARLEALVETGPLQSDKFRPRDAQGDAFSTPDDATPEGFGALRSELEAARGRERELEAAASEASAILGRAMDEVRQLLRGDEAEREDSDEAGELDLGAESAEDIGP